ncbi:MAG: cobyric acid synthase [Bacillota bacterium]
MGFARTIMVQGTGSHVGKSVLVAALCRIFRQDGYAVAPFKAQNMALNSFVTRSGGEMGRSQVVQAQAAGVEPDVDMNPVLLKPTADTSSQVIVQGRPIGNLSAFAYHLDYANKVWPAIVESFERLRRRYEIIVLEGAGSPAEVNLQERDVVNMRAARLANAPVLLAADIDKGGALAAIVGTLELLRPGDRPLVAGTIINKFRGDRKLLQPALDFLEEKTGVPVVGVIPYFTFKIPEEDTVNEELRPMKPQGPQDPGPSLLEIAVLYLPHISNFTDFDPLEREPDVHLRYVRPGEKIGRADLVIIPGSKNTIGDLAQVRKNGWDKEILALAAAGVPVVGICGGFQMLGMEIYDPDRVESPTGEAYGLALLEVTTVFRPEKTTWQAQGEVIGRGGLLEACRGQRVAGYEIHMGETYRGANASPAFLLRRESNSQEPVLDGAVDGTGLVFGSYLHGLFDADGFRRAFLNRLRASKGLPPLPVQHHFAKSQEAAYDKLARLVRENLDMNRIYQFLGLP